MSRSTKEPIRVTSHVARDFLQNATYFNTLPKIVWEYVANSLDAAKEGSVVAVVVEITSEYVKISDDGQGMSRKELRNFFRMHGENIRRKQGKRVRGRFGTGKAAAFGLASRLRIDTVQNGLRNVVELHRRDIEQAKGGESFPVRDIYIDEPTDEGDGTIVEISEFINVKPHTKVDRTISYIERHLSRYRQRARVTVNGHLCKFEEPPSIEQFKRNPPPEVVKYIGNVTLIVKISPVPLNEEERGIDILSYGIWHGTTLAGIEKKEYANRIFGEVDVPILEDGEWEIPAFDNTRNNTLNLQNPVVATLLGWIAQELEPIHQDIASKERQRRQSEEVKRLAKEAQRIANILNEDFAQLEMELELSRRVSRRSGGKSVNEIPDQTGELWPGDGNEPTPWEETGAPHGQGSRGPLGGEGNFPRPGPTARPGEQLGSRKAVTEGKRKRRRAAFSIDFEHGTEKNPRSRYERETKTIYINLDHPQIAGAYEAGGHRIDARQFREICYEVAAVEYALAISTEKLGYDQYYMASDALFDVRDTINRVTKRLAQELRGR